jgi:hypothetical protein
VAPTRDEELARLRIRPDNVHLAGGYGPLIVGIVLFAMVVLLAPTIAPERVVEEPVGGTTTTQLATTTTQIATTTVVGAEGDAGADTDSDSAPPTTAPSGPSVTEVP